MKRMMANSKTVFKEIQSQLIHDDPNEVQAIVLAIMYNYFGLTLTDILSEKEIEKKNLTPIIDRLNRHEPLQYIFERANFFGRDFKVNSSVLIPRPETELLIQEIIKNKPKDVSILDIGTGSGCIAITLKLEMQNSKVQALDLSDEALTVAKQNSNQHRTNIDFVQADFLKNDFQFEQVDIIVSNPPYVSESEKKIMDENVLNYEPPLALFVPDHDPLLFYKAIAEKGKSLLKPSGRIYVEINSQFGKEVKQLFEEAGYCSVRVIKDVDRKDRIVVAQKEN